jgi:hypothetical protein
MSDFTYDPTFDSFSNPNIYDLSYTPPSAASVPVDYGAIANYSPGDANYVAPVIADTPAVIPDQPSVDYGALAAQYTQDPHSAANGLNQPGSVAAAANATGATDNGVSVLTADGTAKEPQGVFSKLMQGMGIQDKNGEVDYSNPATMDKILKAIAISGTILKTLQGPQNVKTASELSSQFKNPYDKFSAPAQSAADAYYGGAYKRHDQQAANNMATPIVAGKRYAEGGGVEPAGDFDSRGPLSLVRGTDSGQADTVKAHLSHGEYVFDADTVAALGDGNNEAGAQILDKWREELRRQKRSAPIDKIPPKAKAPSHYLGKVK